MRSKFKNLVVSGCSFTTNEHVPDGSNWNWPNILAQDTGMKIHNLATAGSGNDHISKSIILYLERHQELTPDNTLVLAMWSGVGRIDWIIDKNSVRDQEPSGFSYDQYTKLKQGGNWWNMWKTSLLDETLINYSKFQDNHSFALHTWLAMENLSNYLEVNGFTHFFTSFLNYKDNLIKGDALVVPFFNILQELNLSIDTHKWFQLKNSEYFGDWCRDRQLLSDDNFHPGLDGPQRWPREILIPKLKIMGILYD